MMNDEAPTSKEMLPDPPAISLAASVPINISHVPHHPITQPKPFETGQQSPTHPVTISPFSQNASNSVDRPVTIAPFSDVTGASIQLQNPSDVAAPHVPEALKHMQHDYLKRKYRRKYEHPEKMRELLAEQTTVCENLTTAVEGKMDIAAIGVLNSIIASLDSSSASEMSTGKATVDCGDRQRALFKAGICPLMSTTLAQLGGQVVVCEKALTAVAYLCRYSEENKSSVCLENCKGFGLSGVCELMIGAIKRHGDEPKVVEAASDAIRCMCALKSNRQRLGESGACEATVRALIKYHQSPDTSAWLCRAIGHLANENEENRSALGVAGACENLIMVLQKFPTMINVVTEAAWAIRQVCPTEDNRARLANDFGPESVMAVYKLHLQQEPFAVEACRGIVNMIADETDDLIPRIANSGFIGYALKSIKKLSESEVLAEHALHGLYLLACEEKSAVKLCTYDILDVLSSSLENHAGHTPVAEWGSRIVNKLMVVPNISGKMRTAGLCEMIPGTVQRQAISAAVSSVGCMAIGDLAKDPANQQRLSSAGACECVVGALKRHGANEDVVYNTCYAIHFLCMTQNNVSWMGAYGGCEAVTTALNKHLNSEEVATNASSALGSLAFKDEGNQVRLFNCGGCLAIVTALRTHSTSANVTENTCRAIYNLCAENVNVKELGMRGACQLVVAAMQTHFSTPSVVTQTLLATYALAVKVKNGKVHNGNTKKLIQKGAIENVIAIMQKYMENEDVQRSAAMAVASLARLEDNRAKLGEAGVCDLIMSAMRVHLATPSVVCKMALAIEVLCHDSGGNKLKLIAAGVIEILIQALSKHEKTAYCVADIFHALVTLSTHEDSKLKIFTENNFKMYVKALKNHDKNVHVAQWGANLIYCAAIDDHNRAKLGALKACENIVNVLNKHGVKSPEVAQWACKAIFGLSLYAENKTRFNTSETCSSISHVLREHYKDPVVAEWSTAALVAVASTSQNRARLGTAIPQLCLTLTQNMGSDAITKLVCEAVYELCVDSHNQSLFLAQNIADLMMATLTHHINNANIAMFVARAISSVCSQNSENATKLGDLGVCELLINGMYTHMYVQPFIQWSCAAIASLSNKNSKNQTSFGVFNAIDAISKGLITHKTSDVVCLQSTRALRILSLHHPDNQLKVSRSNEIIPTCLSIIKRHVMKETIVEHACWILGNIEYKGTAQNRNTVAESRRSLSALDRKAFADIPRNTSLGSLFPAAAGDDQTSETVDAAPSDSARNVHTANNNIANSSPQAAVIIAVNILKPREIYGKSANWDLLFTALQTHYLTHVQCCRWICCAISMFANQGKLAHDNLCDLLLTCLDKHIDSDAVVEKVLQAIGSMARTNIDNNLKFSRGHICDIIDQIISGYSEGNVVISGLLPAIAGLTEGNKDNQVRFGASPSVLRSINSILYNELETEFVSQWACTSIAVLSFNNTKNQQKLSSVCNYIADVIIAHKSNVVIGTEACRAVSALAHLSVTNRNKLGASDACEVIPMIMNTHIETLISLPLGRMEQTSLIFWGVRAMAELAANNPNNQTKLTAHGCIELLVRIMQRQPIHGEMLFEAKLYTAVMWAIGNIVRLGKSEAIADIASGSHRESTASSQHTPLGEMPPNSFANMSSNATGGAFMHMNNLNVLQNIHAATGGGTSGKGQKSSTRFIEARVSEWMLTILGRYMEHPGVVQWGCRAMNNMAKSSRLKSNLLESGASEVLGRVFEFYQQDSGDVIEWAILAKETLEAP